MSNRRQFIQGTSAAALLSAIGQHAFAQPLETLFVLPVHLQLRQPAARRPSPRADIERTGAKTLAGDRLVAFGVARQPRLQHEQHRDDGHECAESHACGEIGRAHV